MLEQQKEAFYHFTLSDMVDLIEQYGYASVINDLDAMIADRVAQKVAEALVPTSVGFKRTHGIRKGELVVIMAGAGGKSLLWSDNALL